MMLPMKEIIVLSCVGLGVIGLLAWAFGDLETAKNIGGIILMTLTEFTE